MAENFKACSVGICNNPVRSRGYCRSHYERLLRHGNPLGGGTPYGEPMRFIHEVALLHTSDDCLTWPFGRGSKGYGQLKIDGNAVYASRYVCELMNGPPPTPEHEAAHFCGKGHEGCIAPRHLSWKTSAENKDDELLHGTRNRGERNGKTKLAEPAVREILAMRGKETQRNLAKKFGVARATVAGIQNGHRWAWLI